MAKEWYKGDPMLDMPLDMFFEPKGLGAGYALLIGVKEYRFTRDVLGAVNDANDWKQLLLERGWKAKNIRVLLNEKATKENAIASIRWLVSDRFPNDSLLFHFSGHGTWHCSAHGWECGLCCTEFEQSGPTARGVISASEWQDELARKHPDAILLTFVDSCFAGGMVKQPRKRLPAKLPIEVREFLKVTPSYSSGESKQYRFLCINEEQITASDARPDCGYVIPLGKDLKTHDDPLIRTLYFEVMYPIVERPHKGKRRFSLKPPDPWMLAIAYIMAEGVIQGLSWDAVKAVLKPNLTRLRRLGLAPTKGTKKRAKAGTSRKGFIWEEYSTDGQKTYELFVGIQEAISKKSRKDRKALLGSPNKVRGPKSRD